MPRVRLHLLTLLAGAMVGCAGAEGPVEHVSSTSQAIIDGTTSPRSQNAIVQLALEGDSEGRCTASLVAKNLVLTARHCVGREEGRAEVTNFTASKLRVYTGQDAPQKIRAGDEPAAIGKKLFTASGSDMFPDVALVLLDRELDNPVATIRLEGGVQKGEVVDIVGYGLTKSGELSDVRLQRKGKKVTDVAPGKDPFGADLHDGEFIFGEAACSGDSGGPALSAASGAVIGVASRVGNGETPKDGTPNFCIGSKAIGIYTALEAAKDIIEKAFEAAGAEPVLEDADATSTASAKGGGDEDLLDPHSTTPVPQAGCSAAPSAAGGATSPALLLAAGLLLSQRTRRRKP